jgi:hypothetical protein
VTLSPWVRSAVDLVLERRKLARREEVVTTVFGPDLGNAPTSAAGWTPGRGEPVWLCQSRGHLFTGCDPANCIYCGDELDG